MAAEEAAQIERLVFGSEARGQAPATVSRDHSGASDAQLEAMLVAVLRSKPSAERSFNPRHGGGTLGMAHALCAAVGAHDTCGGAHSPAGHAAALQPEQPQPLPQPPTQLLHLDVEMASP